MAGVAGGGGGISVQNPNQQWPSVKTNPDGSTEVLKGDIFSGYYYQHVPSPAQVAEERQKEQDRLNAAQQTATTQHTTNSDALATSRLAEDSRQFDASNALATSSAASTDAYRNAQLAQSDPAKLSQLQADAEARRLAALPSYMAALGLGGGTGGAGGTGGGMVEYGGANADAARAATYAQAKDKIANQQRASLTALQNVAAQRGLNVAGGKNPALQAQEGAIIGNAQGQLGDVVRNQAVDDLASQQHVNDQVYNGQIQQRGQNMSMVPSLLGLVTARGLY